MTVVGHSDIIQARICYSKSKSVLITPVVEIMKEKVGENACFNILDALRNDEIIQVLPNGVTTLTVKGINYVEQKFKNKD